MQEKPRLTFKPQDLDALRAGSPGLVKELEQHFAVETSDMPNDDAPAEFAAKVADALKHAMLSSDTDAPYWPCVIRGLGDDPYNAMGIPKDERVKMSGWDAAKLETRDVSALQALTNLGDDDFEEVEEYYELEDFEEGAALLDEASDLQSMRLANTEESTYFVCVLARVDEVLAGVCSISVQT